MARRFETIDIDDGQVRLGDTLIPGVFSRLEVYGDVVYDEIKTKGHSAAKRQIVGYDDQEIELELLLTTGPEQSSYDKLAVLSKLFYSIDRSSAPKVYTILHPHTTARGISQVTFAGMDSEEDNSRDTIRVNLDFVEFNPIIVTAEKQVRNAAGVESVVGNGVTPAAAGEDPAFFAGMTAGVE